ncbi:MAG: hydrolase [Flavobacteriaceae bacterium]|nr:hydrolase [Flavobacteriaceae bacterium]|tara:strand:+ start:15754 stop:18177 length:2424 start_codon:yes stop_codon:yes gene_type:complete
MNYRKLTTILVAFFSCIPFLFSQQKTLHAQRISTAPVIDGSLNDVVWQNITASGNFHVYQPGNDLIIPEEYLSEVKMAYDNEAVYIAAYLYHPNPESIPSQFAQRDDLNAQADQFAVALNTYNDGINETRFYVTSAGTIGDSRVSLGNQDFRYDVVFQCRVTKDANGWYAEYKIPYHALRFPEANIQNWSINFYRRLTLRNETHTWNFIPNGEGRETQYNGPVTGVRDIEPPTRLSLFPFVQGTLSTFDSDVEAEASAGMDIKYGLSDSFTLDATLIPDFGQVAFDPVRLNLGPFEQTFGENRQFFREGIELFNRGGIFFSRRIGGAPSTEAETFENEIIAEAPAKVNLLNALKVSGRTQQNLGVGFLNSVTEKTFATVQDTLTGVQRTVLVEPLSNYNVVVLDQQFNDNSTLSLVNTNVTRNGSFRDANVSALSFNVTDKNNTIRTAGRAIFSNVHEKAGWRSGFRSELDIINIKGNFRYRVGHDFANTTYDINDLGVNFTNNYNNVVVGASYQIFEPTNTFNNYRIEATARHRRLYQPSLQTENEFNINTFFVTTERFAFGSNTNVNSKKQDYFEPRVPGKFVTFHQNIGGNAWVSSDYRKKFAYDLGINYRSFLEDPQRNFGFNVSPRYRFSNRFLVILSADFFQRKDNFGYIDNTDTDVFFGQRDITNLENTLTASYNFDPLKAIDLRFRNFWSTADYGVDRFFKLNDNGSRTLVAYDTSENDPNRNFNIWNLDVRFRWRFAPGSEASLLYRNQLFNQNEAATLSYTESLDQLFAQPQLHSLSLRITYFVDYNSLVQLTKKNS